MNEITTFLHKSATYTTFISTNHYMSIQ